jgi:hypothetical protein
MAQFHNHKADIAKRAAAAAGGDDDDEDGLICAARRRGRGNGEEAAAAAAVLEIKTADCRAHGTVTCVKKACAVKGGE